ncbi:uncharacterized protein TNCV_4949081 [Trichonephila clavipes]|nr:uncharacterized protein TNCV_4949081 [Trichonephila clavipes]
MQVSSGTQNNSSANEPSCTTVTVSFSGVLLVLTGTWRSPYKSRARIRLRTNPGLVGKHHKDHCCGHHNSGLYSRLIAGDRELR